jgi:hypothetical protein
MNARARRMSAILARRHAWEDKTSTDVAKFTLLYAFTILVISRREVNRAGRRTS